MNFENVKALADLINTNNLTAIEVGKGENRIRVERQASAFGPIGAPFPGAPFPIAMASNPIAQEAPQQEGIPASEPGNFTEITSPLVGVYYSAASPDSEPFISIGKKIKKGDVLCIIEAMKLMNEVISEHDGEIVDICIKNGDIAEFGQVLFKLR
ncbi:MAG: acetyl-CoA carboxylase biotin carboxyl carrier protein [Oscillospiraceae bacterium]|nr:acetyl-CoA carboxylase biotin carboxyl carrier protein [Oscillospiraceae bacterium]